ncbi:orf152b (mitochondrion) [Oryza sativa Japonica Group]|jgi:hypothetical protein|uniref:Orf152b protein n=4 Tax=Oryza TaxID=4527 RepID=Q8HCP4_ORYSJ|nr:orf152b [Oryza sativa Japonica Group]YP_514663.1 hypothetical protein OrsaiPp35 [Oryza sativa Indica Group]QBE89914.1 hypothetical protein [Oryza sativa]BAN67486.1 hypothetical protein [Oryza rufipogon]AAZ99234.1 hypothetical protein [Oryza sativa Indica Group]AAZ99288.1 hypothetical protein [Oryza sativa Japonica Group]AAZ99341.1 hypothetical protein [Oryza sativa Japonica Group]|eukprot:YP_002000573.1 orf152b (mitochondrion) [Oryza sativa Japonica Group]
MWPSLQAHIWIWSTLFHPILIYFIPAIDSNSLFSNCTLKAKAKKDHINYSPNCRISHRIQMEDRKRRQFKPNGQTLRIQDRKTYSHKRITREQKQLHILLACLSDLLSNCHGSTTEDWLLRPSTRSWAIPDRQADGMDSLYMDGRNASTAEP